MISNGFAWTRRFTNFFTRKDTSRSREHMAPAASGPIHPPGPKGISVLACCLARRREPLTELGKLTRQYGDIIHIQLGRRHGYLINHPDYFFAIIFARPSLLARSTPPCLKRLF